MDTQLLMTVYVESLAGRCILHQVHRQIQRHVHYEIQLQVTSSLNESSMTHSMACATLRTWQDKEHSRVYRICHKHVWQRGVVRSVSLPAGQAHVKQLTIWRRPQQATHM
jgi:hypothetical protein